MLAICFKCGTEKPDALVSRARCHVTPRTNSEYAVSLALSDRLSSEEQLTRYSRNLSSGLKVSVPRQTLVVGVGFAEKSHLCSRCSAALSPTQTSETPTPSQAATRPGPPMPKTTMQASIPISLQSTSESHATKTMLHKSPFAVLGATIRDNRRRIVELAEEKTLELDDEVCQKARSDLTNPRTRLGAEIAWLPGVSPRKALQLIGTLLGEPMTIRAESGLPTLAHLNLLAAGFETVDGKHDADDLVNFIQEFAYLAEDIDLDDVRRDINEDRSVSGFPEVQSMDQVEVELAERKRYYRSAIKDALNRLPPTKLIRVMTDVVEDVTLGGEEHGPELVNDLVDTYEVETQGFLQKEAENVHKLITTVRNMASSGEGCVKPYVDKLDAVARNWTG